MVTASQGESQQAWANQPLDQDGNSTIFDDSVISSILPPRIDAAPQLSSPSSPIVAPTLSRASSNPGMFATPMIQSEPSSPIFSSTSFPLITAPARNRFSTTASALIGRTTAAQRAAIDLRLSDVTSSECLAARIQATQSRPTRSSTGVSRPSKAWTKELRRMSYVEGGKAQAQARRDLLDEGTWDSDVFPTKKISLDSRLPSQRLSMEGEIGVVKNVRAKTSVWKGRAAARTISLKQATTLILTSNEPVRDHQRPRLVAALVPVSAQVSNAEVERNSSVSSSTSSSGTSRDTSHSSTDSVGTQITPASSVPPSPTTGYLELDMDSQRNPSGIGYSPIRRRTSSIIGSVRRLSRQSSRGDIGSGATTPPVMESPESSISLSSMIGTLLSGSRRSRSSPSLNTHCGLAESSAPRYIMPSHPNPLGPRLPSLDFSPSVRTPAVLHKSPPVTTDRSVAESSQSSTKKSTTAAPKATSRFFFRKLTPLHPPPAR